MGKTVHVPHFNRDTIEYASRERDESKPGIKTLRPFLKNVTEESDFKNFQDFIVSLDACYLLQKAIQQVYRCDSVTIEGAIVADLRRRFPASQKILCTVCR